MSMLSTGHAEEDLNFHILGLRQSEGLEPVAPSHHLLTLLHFLSFFLGWGKHYIIKQIFLHATPAMWFSQGAGKK